MNLWHHRNAVILLYFILSSELMKARVIINEINTGSQEKFDKKDFIELKFPDLCLFKRNCNRQKFTGPVLDGYFIFLTSWEVVKGALNFHNGPSSTPLPAGHIIMALNLTNYHFPIDNNLFLVGSDRLNPDYNFSEPAPVIPKFHSHHGGVLAPYLFNPWRNYDFIPNSPYHIFCISIVNTTKHKQFVETSMSAITHKNPSIEIKADHIDILASADDMVVYSWDYHIHAKNIPWSLNHLLFSKLSPEKQDNLLHTNMFKKNVTKQFSKFSTLTDFQMSSQWLALMYNKELNTDSRISSILDNMNKAKHDISLSKCGNYLEISMSYSIKYFKLDRPTPGKENWCLGQNFIQIVEELFGNNSMAHQTIQEHQKNNLSAHRLDQTLAMLERFQAYDKEATKTMKQEYPSCDNVGHGINKFIIKQDCLTHEELLIKTRNLFSKNKNTSNLIEQYLNYTAQYGPASSATAAGFAGFLGGIATGAIGSAAAFVSIGVGKLGNVAAAVASGAASWFTNILGSLFKKIFGRGKTAFKQQKPTTNNQATDTDFLDDLAEDLGYSNDNDENDNRHDDNDDDHYQPSTTTLASSSTSSTTSTTTTIEPAANSNDICLLTPFHSNRVKRMDVNELDPLAKCSCIFRDSQHLSSFTKDSVEKCPAYFSSDRKRKILDGSMTDDENMQKNELFPALDLMKLSVEDLPLSSGAENKLDLILQRGNATFHYNWVDNCKDYEDMFENKYVCQYHINAYADMFHLRNKNFKESRKGRDFRRVCQFPKEIDQHKSPLPWYLPITKQESEILMERKKHFLATGKGLCKKHHVYVQNLLAEKLVEMKGHVIHPPPVTSLADTPIIRKSQRTKNKQCSLGTAMDDTVETKLFDEDVSFEISLSESTMLEDDSIIDDKSEQIEKMTTALRNFAEAAQINHFHLSKSFLLLAPQTQRQRVGAAKQFLKTFYSLMAPDSPEEFENSVTMPSYKKGWTASGQSQKLRSVLESIAQTYTDCTSKVVCKHRALSMCPLCTYREIEQYIPGLTRHMFGRGRRYVRLYGPGKQIEQKRVKRLCIKENSIRKFIEFITDPSIITDMPYGTAYSKTTDGDKIVVPNVIRNQQVTRIAKQYTCYLEEHNLQHQYGLSDSTMFKFLEICVAKTRRSVLGLDYFTYAGVEAVDSLLEILDQMKGMAEVSDNWIDEHRKLLKEMKNYIKVGLKVHLRSHSPVLDHCFQYSLSDKDDDSFRADCAAEHNQRCSSCENIKFVLNDIIQLTNMEIWPNSQIATETRYVVNEAQHDIDLWIAHQIRAQYQELIKSQILDLLTEKDVFLQLDWGMKILPMYGRETQSQFFGKRGMGIHHAFAMTVHNGKIHKRGYTHVFDSVVQDGASVSAILYHIIGRIKTELPAVEYIYLRSDNAACYHGSQTIATIPEINNKLSGIKVKLWSFSEAQDGKGPCDQMAAVVKNHVRQYVAENNKVTNGLELITAASSYDGVKGIDIFLGTINNLDPEPELEKPTKKTGRKTAKATKKAEIPGIINYHDFEFSGNSIHVWKHRGIGNGKEIDPKRWKGLGYKSVFHEIKHSPSKTKWNVATTNRKADAQESLEKDNMAAEQDLEVPIGDNGDSDALFECPQDGCIHSYASFKRLKNHIDVGHHTYKSERINARDYALYTYKSLLENHYERGITEIFEPIKQELETMPCSPKELPMGWALKEKKKTSRFDPEVREWLVNKYDEGVNSKKKWNGADLARTMRRITNDDGQLIFSTAQYLKASQISSFFSRLHRSREQQGAQHTMFQPTLGSVDVCTVGEGDPLNNEDDPDADYYNNDYSDDEPAREVERLALEDGSISKKGNQYCLTDLEPT